jgi:hypothetical protein
MRAGVNNSCPFFLGMSNERLIILVPKLHLGTQATPSSAWKPEKITVALAESGMRFTFPPYGGLDIYH